MKRLLLILFLLSIVCFYLFITISQKKEIKDLNLNNISSPQELTILDILSEITSNIFNNSVRFLEYSDIKKFVVEEPESEIETEDKLTKASEIPENLEEESKEYKINFTFLVEDYNGNIIHSQTYFYKNIDRLKNETEEEKIEYNLITKLDKKIDKIEIKNLEVEENKEYKIKIDLEIPLEKVSDAVDIYSISTDTLNFKEAIITAKAKGNELWKCEDWDFNERECKRVCRFDEENNKEICEDNWKRIMEIKQGEYYSFVITEGNVGYAERLIDNNEKVNRSEGETNEKYEISEKEGETKDKDVIEEKKDEIAEIDENETKNEIGDSTENEISEKEKGENSEKNEIVKNFWPMAIGNYWLFENENGTESYLFEIKECYLTKDCFSIYKTDIIENIIAINDVVFDGNILYKLSAKVNKIHVDYTKNPVPILYIGNGTKTYNGKAEKQNDLYVKLTSLGLKNITTKVGEFEAYALNYYSKRSKNGITIVEANYTVYYALGIGPVQIDWIDGSVHKLKDFVIK